MIAFNGFLRKIVRIKYSIGDGQVFIAEAQVVGLFVCHIHMLLLQVGKANINTGHRAQFLRPNRKLVSLPGRFMCRWRHSPFYNYKNNYDFLFLDEKIKSFKYNGVHETKLKRLSGSWDAGAS